MTLRTGVVRKWIESEGWGFANSYDNGDGAPERFYVHTSKLVPGSGKIQSGTLISFIVGQPRYPGECPAALQIEITSQPRLKSDAPSVSEVL
jgi:hypothetical protein